MRSGGLLWIFLAAWLFGALSALVSDEVDAASGFDGEASGVVLLLRSEPLLEGGLNAFLEIQPGRYLASSTLERACVKPGLRRDALLLFVPDTRRCQALEPMGKLLLPQHLAAITGRPSPPDLSARLETQPFVALAVEEREASSKLSLTAQSSRSAACVCPVDSFTVGGTVTGLVGDRVVLQNNGGDNLEVIPEGPSTFAFSPQSDDSSYAVTVLTQPVGPAQLCSVANAFGILAGANVTNVVVNCVTQTGQIERKIGGTVTGLVGTGLMLQNNQGDDLLLAENGAFSFPTALPDGSDYAVTVKNQPSGPSQVCALVNATGTLQGSDVDNIEVACTTQQFSVGGTVSGLAGTGLVLRNNDDVDLPIEDDGLFSFPPQDDGTIYDVTVVVQPSNPSQSCQIRNGLGTLAGANVSSIGVVCTMNTAPQGATACRAQTRPAGGPVAAIDFLASDADGDELTGVFTYRLDGGPLQEGLPSSLESACETGAGALQCTITGNTPAQAGAYSLILMVSDGTASIELVSLLTVTAEVIFRDDFALPVCR